MSVQKYYAPSVSINPLGESHNVVRAEDYDALQERFDTLLKQAKALNADLALLEDDILRKGDFVIIDENCWHKPGAIAQVVGIREGKVYQLRTSARATVGNFERSDLKKIKRVSPLERVCVISSERDADRKEIEDLKEAVDLLEHQLEKRYQTIREQDGQIKGLRSEHKRLSGLVRYREEVILDQAEQIKDLKEATDKGKPDTYASMEARTAALGSDPVTRSQLYWILLALGLPCGTWSEFVEGTGFKE